MEILPGKTLENSGKQNPKMGFKSPRAEGKSGVHQFLRLFDRFRSLKIDIPVLMPRKLTIGKTSKISTAKIAALPKPDFVEIAAACEPLCAFLYFCDLAIQSKFGAKAVK
jgi:hypothetical protein